MSNFVNNNGFQMSISGHVLMVRGHNLNALLAFAVQGLVLPWSISDEDDCYQLSHPLDMEERVEYSWLYHRMKALDKQDDLPDDDGPGPLVA